MTIAEFAAAVDALEPGPGRTILVAIHDTLWPADDVEVQWDSETLDNVASLVDAALPGLLEAKKAADSSSDPR